ncbi:gamma-glutamyltransferase [Magnetospirillum sp. UT-4]|uniref:gamma-glutamyltransferase n=1 Tax=Magnetospirillum sp. UT-4 TaxID=2681467 RepID=UPI00137D9300|nr:gamma-glutamyltransferase [Magnetospirillum sp. UT-4]CAA7616365.1 putative gamma-glutamyltransferase ywrD [Magnetospirillum sp. UT-4]
MPNTPMARRGMVASPHHLASQAGLAVLRDGGNAIEAALATAAAAAVLLPHACGLGGDGFWLIAEPGRPPISIDGSGSAAAAASPELFRGHGLEAVPATGPLAAITVAGAVSGWQLALDLSEQWGGGMPLERLFEDAVHHARAGFAITSGQAAAAAANLAVLKATPGFASSFLGRNDNIAAGAAMTLPALADTLERLAAAGLDDFYRGAVARAVAEDLRRAGSPLKAEDFARHRGMRRRPLSLGLAAGTVHATAPPTQGLAALILLGLLERRGWPPAGTFGWIQALAEAAGAGARVRDTHLADPHRMAVHAATYLSDHVLDRMAAEGDSAPEAPWRGGAGTEAAWVGVVDGQGRTVSCVHGLFGPFGAGVVLPASGIVWHNRGAAFGLDPARADGLEPRRRPPHGLAPLLARLKDGRLLAWGGSGGDGLPQVLAQLFGRALAESTPADGNGLQAAVSAPRFARAGKRLCLEDGFTPDLAKALAEGGWAIDPLPRGGAALGQAGILLRRPDGIIAGAADPRGDGAVAGW